MRSNSGVNHYKWKGGKPKCLVCGSTLTSYKNRYCLKHYHTEEHNQKMSAVMVGKKHKPMSQEGRENIRKAKVGVKLSLEHIRNISLGNKGKPRLHTRGENSSNWKDGVTKIRWKDGFYFKQRMSRLRKNGGFHSEAEWETLKAQYNWTCPICKQKEPFSNLKTKKLTKDHIIPISKGGSDNIENIQPMCKRCNSHKWAN